MKIKTSQILHARFLQMVHLLFHLMEFEVWTIFYGGSLMILSASAPSDFGAAPHSMLLVSIHFALLLPLLPKGCQALSLTLVLFHYRRPWGKTLHIMSGVWCLRHVLLQSLQASSKTLALFSCAFSRSRFSFGTATSAIGLDRTQWY